MLVHKGGQINNVQLITGLRIAENGSYCENVKKGRKSQGGGGMCTKYKEWKLLRKGKKVSGGGGYFFFWGGGQGGCELRSEAFVNIQKKIIIIFFFGGGGGGGGGSRWGGGGGGGSGWM